MRPLRVGIDAHVLNGRYQGSRTWLIEILRRAPRLGEDIEFVVYSGDPGASARLLHFAPVEHRPIPTVNAVVRNLFVWPRLARRDDLALLVTQYFSSPRIASLQIPVVHDVLFETHPHFFPWRYRLRNRVLVRWSVKRSRLVITVSEYSKKRIVDRYRRRPEDIAIVGNGVDAKLFAAAEGPAVDPTDGRPYGLFVGRLEPRKNLRLALAALRLVSDPEARLVVVGRNDFEDPSILEQLAAEPRAIHLVDVGDHILRQLYRGAAVLIYPSLGEGWGVPILESLAAGTPVIASSVTAIPEVGGDCCYYFSPTAPDAADRLAELLALALEGRLEFDAEAAADRVAQLSWDHASEQFLSALRRAAAL